MHNRIYSGEKPFQCPVCDKGVRAFGSLNKYMTVHMQIKHTSVDCLANVLSFAAAC